MRIRETSSEKGRSKPMATRHIGDPFSSKSYMMQDGTIQVLFDSLIIDKYPLHRLQS